MFVAVLALVSVLWAAPAGAREPDVVLPLAGVALDLRDSGRTTYRVSATWSLRDTLYEGHDVITETTEGQSTTTWLAVGWLDNLTCADLLAHAPIDAAWARADVRLWGERWFVRGGVSRHEEALAGRPVIALCRARGEHKAALVTHFLPASRFADEPDALLDALRRARVPTSISAALQGPRTVDTRPAERAGVVNVGPDPAVRTVRMRWAGFEVELPRDGNVWIAAPDEEGLDLFERVAPALPELSIIVARLEGAPSCEVAFDLIGGAPLRRAPVGLPEGWRYGRTLVTGDYRGIGLCRPYASGVILAGVATGNDLADVTAAAPLLTAIARAADAAVSPREGRRALPPGFLIARWAR